MADEVKPIIVCVDDKPEFLGPFQGNLSARYGERYVVEVYTDGKTALGEIADAKGEGEVVALAIVDHQMDGMKGVDMLINLMEGHPEVKRLLLTGEAKAPDVVKGVNAGAIQQYVRKEFMDDKGLDVYMSIDLLLSTFTAERIARARQATLDEIAGFFHRQTLPSSLPDIAGYSVGCVYKPLEIVGGDFYDFFEIGEGVYGMLVGDVQGHGVEAALIAKLIIDNIRSNVEHLGSPSTTLTEINGMFLLYKERVLGVRIGEDDAEGCFCTLFYGVLNTNTDTFTFSSAGHDAPYHIAVDGNVSEFYRGEDHFSGFPIGLSECEYNQDSRVINPGEVVLCHTDGVKEALDPDDNQFGSKFEDTLRANRDLPIDQLVDAVRKSCDTHRGGTSASDDVTLLGFGYDKMDIIG